MGEDSESGSITTNKGINKIKPTDLHEPGRSSYGRIIKPTTRMIESWEQFKARGTRRLVLHCDISERNRSLYVEPTTLLVDKNDPIAFASQVGDTMYLHQALKDPDRIHFKNDRRKHWKLQPIMEIPDCAQVLDSIWAMRCNRFIGTGEVHKYKAMPMEGNRYTA